MAGFLVGAVLALTLASVVFLARPGRLQNRALALLLWLEGLSSLGAAVHLAFNAENLSWAGLFCFFLFWILTIGAYPLFLGTLRTPLARPLGRPIVLAAVWIAVGVWAASMFVVPHRFLEGPYRIDGAIEFAYGPAAQWFVVVSLPLLLYALAVAFSAWRSAPTGSARRGQARAYVAAFVVRDALLLVSVVNFLALPWFVREGLFGSAVALTIGRSVYIAQIVLFPVIAGYGILKHQLFDIDLRVKWTLRRVSPVPVLAGAFFLAKEAIEAILPVEGVLPSIAAAAAIGLLALPAWRAAGRLADRLLPGVEDTPGYRADRRREIYGAAVESALLDGVISDKERDVLTTLARQLALAPKEARGIERAATTGGGA